MRVNLLLLSLILLTPALPGCVPAVAVGAGAGAAMAADPRSTGTYIDDEGIELKASNLIYDKFKDNDKIHVNITSYNRNVLLTGEVPAEAAREEIGQLARSVTGVREVSNEIVVAPAATFSSRSNDTYITSKVKGRMIDAQKFPVNRVKVVTENGVVYLLGLVTPREAEDAVTIARTTSGVKKVVKVFELQP